MGVLQALGYSAVSRNDYFLQLREEGIGRRGEGNERKKREEEEMRGRVKERKGRGEERGGEGKGGYIVSAMLQALLKATHEKK